MNRQERSGFDKCGKASGTPISRRVVMGGSGAAVLGLLSGPALGQEAVRRRAEGEMPPEMQERMRQSRVFSERLRRRPEVRRSG